MEGETFKKKLHVTVGRALFLGDNEQAREEEFIAPFWSKDYDTLFHRFKKIRPDCLHIIEAWQEEWTGFFDTMYILNLIGTDYVHFERKAV